MNIETLIGLCLGGLAALFLAHKLFKFSKNAPKEGHDEYDWLRPIAKGVSFGIVLLLLVGALIQLQHFKVIDIPTGSPVAGNELPRQSPPDREPIAPQIEAVGGRVTMDEAAVEHDEQLEKFKADRENDN